MKLTSQPMGYSTAAGAGYYSPDAGYAGVVERSRAGYLRLIVLPKRRSDNYPVVLNFTPDQARALVATLTALLEDTP